MHVPGWLTDLCPQCRYVERKKVFRPSRSLSLSRRRRSLIQTCLERRHRSSALVGASFGRLAQSIYFAAFHSPSTQGRKHLSLFSYTSSLRVTTSNPHALWLRVPHLARFPSHADTFVYFPVSISFSAPLILLPPPPHVYHITPRTRHDRVPILFNRCPVWSMASS